MMSDKPRPSIFALSELYAHLDSFLDGVLSEQSYRVVKARLSLLELAGNQNDVDVFRSALRPLLDYLSHHRGLIPPQHLVEFAQDSATTATGMRQIADCQADRFGIGSLSVYEHSERSQNWC